MSSFDPNTQCPNCEKDYRVTDINSLHVPLILQCNHSCCEGCIRELISSSKNRVVLCRKCGVKSIPKTAVGPSMKNLRDHFPVADRTVLEMRASQKPKLRDESQIGFPPFLQPRKNVDKIEPAGFSNNLCIDCAPSIVPAVVRCYNCEVGFFCQKCSDSLHSKAYRQHHRLIKLGEDAASCASDSSGSVCLNVKDLEHQQILRGLLDRSQLKIETIDKSLQFLKDQRALYDHFSLRYDRIEKELRDYFEQAFNILTLKRKEMLKSIDAVKSSWHDSSKACERELLDLRGNLSNMSKRLRTISDMDQARGVNISEHMKRIQELLKKSDSIVVTPPEEPPKQTKLTFNWVSHLEHACSLNFGSGGSVSLIKTKEDTNLLDRNGMIYPNYNRNEMMHPNYDYSADDYDFNNIKVLPNVHRTKMVSDSLSCSVASTRTPSFVSDVREDNSHSSYHSSPEVSPSKFTSAVSRQGSVASRQGSVASASRQDSVASVSKKSSVVSASKKSSVASASKRDSVVSVSKQSTVVPVAKQSIVVPVSDLVSVASQISSSSSLAASHNQNGSVNNQKQSRRQKSYTIHPTNHKTSKMPNEDEAWHDATSQAAGGKQQKSYHKNLENFGRLVSRSDEHPNVRVSHVVNPTHFYVQLNCVKGYFKLFAEEFSDAPSWPIPVLSDIPKGTVCIKVGPNDERDRVRVMQHQENAADENDCLIKVFYLDIGHEDKVPLSALRVPKQFHIKKKAEWSPLAILCSLYDCYPATSLMWEKEVIEFFKNYTSENRLDLEIGKRTASKLEVDLKVHGNFASSIRQLMLDTGKATVCSERHNIVPLQFSDEQPFLYDTDFREGTTIDVKVSHISSPCDFYAQRTDTAGALEKLTNRLNSVYKNEKNFKAAALLNPFVGQKVAAKYFEDGSWYRAEIVKINPSHRKFCVKYVDYGNEAVVNEKSIARLGQEFFKVTVQAFRCTLRDIAPINDTWSGTPLKTFKLCVEDSVLQMLVQEIKSDNILSVSLYKNANPNKNHPISVQTVLIQKGMARGVGELAGVKSLKKQTQPGKNKQKNNVDAENGIEENNVSVATNAISDEHSSEVPDEETFNVTIDDAKRKGRHEPPVKRSEVKIMSIYNPNKVFLNFLDKCSNVTNITTDLKIFYEDTQNNESTIVESIEKGGKFAVFSNEDSKWYRGVVQSCSDDGDAVEVNLIDFVEKKMIVSKDNIRSLPEKFTRDMDGVIKCALVDFEENHEDWSPEFCEKINAELAKCKEFWVVIKSRNKGILNVVLWGRSVKCSGPLDPIVEKWTLLNEKFQRMERYDADGNSESSSQGYAPVVEKVQMLDEETDPLDPTEQIQEWLENSEASGNNTNYANMVNGNNYELAEEGGERESDGTIEVGEIDDILDSVSTIDQDLDWLPPLKLDTDRFTGKVTHVDWGFNLYIQITERSHETLEFISAGLKSVYENSLPKPDDLNNWHPGQICIAFWRFDKKWYRARVKKLKANDLVEVEYVDYGTDEIIPVRDLRRNVALLDMPIQCYKFPIRSDVTPTSEDGKWTEPVLEFTHTTIVEKICDVFLWKEPGEDFYRIEKLIIPSMVMGNLFDFLVSLTHIVISKPLKVQKPTQRINQIKEESEKDDESSTSSSDSSVIMPIERIRDEEQLLKQVNKEFDDASSPINCWTVPQISDDSSRIVSYCDVPIGQTLMVKVTEVFSVTEIAVNIISCDNDPAIREGYEIYQTMFEDLQKEASEFPKLDPPYLGRICCTKFNDGVWYRGQVVAKNTRSPQNVPVFYIDYGNVSFTPVSELHELKSYWYHIPMQSVKCILDDIELPKSKSEIERFEVDLSNTLMNNEFSAVIENFQTDERIYSIRLQNDDGELPYHSKSKSSES